MSDQLPWEMDWASGSDSTEETPPWEMAQKGAPLDVSVTDEGAGDFLNDPEFQRQLAAENRTLPQSFHMGVGDVAQGVGDVIGLVTNPLNTALNMTGAPKAFLGQDLGTDMGATLRGLTGAPDPVTTGEKYGSALNRGGAGALTGIGLAAPLAGAAGTTGAVAGEVLSNPVRDVISGLTGGAGAQAGDDIGGIPGAIIGGIAGAVGGAHGARAAEALADRIATAFPRSVILDDANNLTDEGREIILRTGAQLEDVQRSYTRLRSKSKKPTSTEELNRDTDAIIQGMGGTPAPVPEAGTPPPVVPKDAFTEAKDEGIQLTRGQAEQDFSVQNDENSMRAVATKEGEKARQFFNTQQEQIRGAVERFKQSFGKDAGSAADRGAIVKQAVSDLRDHGAEGVRELYRQAESLGGDGLKLDTKVIHDAATDVLIDEAVPEGVKRAVSQELARYGIIGKAQPTNEAGITKVTLDDGSSVQFRGPPKQLTASNAEDLRKAINRLYDPTKPNLSGQSIKPAIDDALEAALEQTADQGAEGISDAYGAARDAFKTQKKTFAAKDIIDNLIASKKDTDTPVLLPEKAIAQVIGSGADGITNLRKVKGLLLSKPTESSKQAWAAIQHQSLADIFDGAIQRNVNTGGDMLENISGAKLRTQIFDKFGKDKLKIVLGDEEFNRLMALQRVIGNATIPLSGTTNPSGTFTKLVNYMGRGALKFTGGFGDAAVALAGKARDLATTRKTLEGITSYDGKKSTGERLDKQAREFIKDYIDKGSAGTLVPSTINLSATQLPKGADK